MFCTTLSPLSRNVSTPSVSGEGGGPVDVDRVERLTLYAADMNPCQGHILELKLAAVQVLDYSDFWKIFGEGRHEDFERLLTMKISPFLSSCVTRLT
jgi:hypothetical protein